MYLLFRLNLQKNENFINEIKYASLYTITNYQCHVPKLFQ